MLVLFKKYTADSMEVFGFFGFLVFLDYFLLSDIKWVQKLKIIFHFHRKLFLKFHYCDT